MLRKQQALERLWLYAQPGPWPQDRNKWQLLPGSFTCSGNIWMVPALPGIQKNKISLQQQPAPLSLLEYGWALAYLYTLRDDCFQSVYDTEKLCITSSKGTLLSEYCTHAGCVWSPNTIFRLQAVWMSCALVQTGKLSSVCSSSQNTSALSSAAMDQVFEQTNSSAPEA